MTDQKTNSETELIDSLAGNHKWINARLHELEKSFSSSEVRLKGRFFFLPFRDSKPTTEEFVDYLYWALPSFCIPRKERHAAIQKSAEEKHERWSMECTDKAKNLFVQGIKQQKTSGEPGELTLFCILEGKMTAPLIACKMYLKTSLQMHVHGTDGIHLLIDPETKDPIILWGESKIHSSFKNAFSSLIESIEEFSVKTENGKSRRDRDIDIIRDHQSIEGPYKDLVIKLFDPYDETSNKRKEGFACFIGYDDQAMAAIKSDADIETFFQSYFDSAVTACKDFEKQIKEKDLLGWEFFFFLIPFSTVQELRVQFFKKIGAPVDPNPMPEDMEKSNLPK